MILSSLVTSGELSLSEAFCWSQRGHSSKNMCGQITSPARLGAFWVDLAGALVQGLPPTAYSRSDCLAAMCYNSFYYHVSQLKVSWPCRGALLFSLCVALASAPLAHKSMTMRDRAESAVSGLVLWDVFPLLSARKQSWPVRSLSAHGVPVCALQHIAMATLMFLIARKEWGTKTWGSFQYAAGCASVQLACLRCCPCQVLERKPRASS